MTDEYPPEWDDQPPPDPLDPRLGTVFDQLQPTAVEKALVAEIVHLYISRDHRFGKAFEHFWTDRYRDTRWPNVFIALLEAFAVTAVGSQGEPLAIARCEGDLKAARAGIIEFGPLS